MSMLMEEYARQCIDNIVPDIIACYSNNQETVALVHFVDSNVTKMGIYDMVEHELRPWTVDYSKLEMDYYDNLSYCINFWNKTKPDPLNIITEDAVIWVGFQPSPGYWHGRGDAKSGFIVDGLVPYDDDEYFILDSHPDQRVIPNWVMKFIVNIVYGTGR